MIRKFILFVFFAVFNLSYAQQEVIDRYPKGQFFYIGGQNALEKEMIKIVKDKGLVPCPQTEEVYMMKILVNPDASIKYVKDFDTLNIAKNKCAFNFGRKLIPNLKRWMPAKEEGKFVGAIITIKIDPFFLYYSKDDPKDNVLTKAEFKKGMNVFSNQITRIFQEKIRINEDRSSSFIFVINEKGIIENVQIYGDYSETDEKQLVSEITRIKGWLPATFNGIPRKTRLRQPLTQRFDFQIENQQLYDPMQQNGFYRSR